MDGYMHDIFKTCARQNILDSLLVTKLKEMLDEHNVFAKSFRMAKDRYDYFQIENLNLLLITDGKKDGRIYNLPIVLEVAAVIVGDANQSINRDIILERQSGHLQRINELHPSYLGLQYPFLWNCSDIKHRDIGDSHQRKRNRLIIREFLCFKLQSRKDEAQTLLRSRRLFQQFIVDGYTMMEAKQLLFIRTHQKQLHCVQHNTLKNAHQPIENQNASCGKRIILPSSFVATLLDFQICFLTFTCNPYWPEIQRSFLGLNLTAQDWLDIVTRVFKLKLQQLMSDLKGKKLGNVLAYIYTIEFQRRGLPHAHILLFLDVGSKYPSLADIDRIISAEIPDSIVSINI
ncbi:hypothetical protein GmHk_11G032932 [Glycine max]|nr:hypothetical protein GmHk_11G032932 [Glycine max]